MTEIDVTLKGHGIVEGKKVSLSGNSGRVIVPRHWVGGKVTVILTSKPGKESEEISET